ncbi:MAG: hypothetical protein HQL66_10365 [Magnetococcales bacterium]|nr:hypothetical protein [Magnetococcales bacterium]
MAKTTHKTAQEILDQVAKAREVLAYFAPSALDERGGFRNPSEVRARLNAAKAHIVRAGEKAQSLP